MRVKNIFINKFSSNYGDDNNSFGQPLGVKSIVILSVESEEGIKRSHELYAGIYVPELIEPLVNYLSKIYLNKTFNLNNLKNGTKGIPFITNTGLLHSIKGAIDSCILQIIFFESGITLVEGLKNLLHKNIQRKSLSRNIKFYASGGSVAFNEKRCLIDVKNAIKNKYNGFKMRCGLQEFEKDIKRVFKVASYIKDFSYQNDNFSLMIDFIQGTLYPRLTKNLLIKYNDAFRDLNILWYEEPMDPDDICKYKKLPNEILGKSCLGESFSSFNEFVAFENILKRFQIDITHLGGFIEGIKVLNYFSDSSKEIKFTSHVWGSKLSLLLNLALCKACNLIEWFEIPLLSFDINNHLFRDQNTNLMSIDENDIENLINDINLGYEKKYDFVNGSGYAI